MSHKIITRRSRSMGYKVTMGHADALGLECEPGHSVYYTICEQHDLLCGHPTYRLARDHMSAPEGWCEDCGEEYDR